MEKQTVDIRKKFLNRYRFLFGKRLKNGDEIDGILEAPYPTVASDIAYKVKNGRKFLDSDVTRGIAIYEKVWQYNPDLLEEADALAEKDRLANEQKAISSDNKLAEITLDLVQQMVEWDKRKRILEDWKWKAMKDVVDGKKGTE